MRLRHLLAELFPCYSALRLRTSRLRCIFGTMHDEALPPSQSYLFRYLRQLRADGRTNMYGAVPYLMKTFDLDRDAAFEIVCHSLGQQEQSEPMQPSRSRRVRSKSN